MQVFLILFFILLLSACNPEAKAPAAILKAPEKKLEAEMKSFVNATDLVVALQLVDVDFERNTRDTVWLYSDVPALSAAYQKSISGKNKIGNTPWMMRSLEVNKNQIWVIEGNVSCVPIEKTRLDKNIPEITQYVRSVCVIGVPPIYGELSGYMTVWLNRTPKAEELPELITKMRGYAIRIGEAQ